MTNHKGPEPLRWLLIEDVAQILGVSPECLRRWIRLGKLEAYRWGGRLRFKSAAVYAFRDSPTVTAPLPATQERAAARRRHRVSLIKRRDRGSVFMLRIHDLETGTITSKTLQGVRSRRRAKHMAAAESARLNGEAPIPEPTAYLPGHRYHVGLVKRKDRPNPFMLRITDRRTGKPSHETLPGVGAREQGRAWELAREREHLLNSLPEQTPPIPWTQAREKMLASAEKGVNAQTFRDYRATLRRFERYATGQLGQALQYVQQVDGALADGFQAQRCREAGPVTVNRDLRELHVLWSHLSAGGQSAPNPWSGKSLPAGRREKAVKRLRKKTVRDRTLSDRAAPPISTSTAKTLQKSDIFSAEDLALTYLNKHPNASREEIARAVRRNIGTTYKWLTFNRLLKSFASSPTKGFRLSPQEPGGLNGIEAEDRDR